MDLSYLSEMAKLNSLMQIPLKRLTLQLSLSLSVDPGAVLHRLQKSSSSNLPRSEASTTACFNHVVYPTAQHVISRPPLPFSVITNRRDEDGLNTGNMPLPSFLIECFLAPQQSYDPQGRQSCLPMLYNVDGNGDYV
ncbi:hypothetical protein Ddc_17826 [Ditylenchus destructor]|nr:hypothetical protein Ddc_17826 [Ditylenchus destructor]